MKRCGKFCSIDSKVWEKIVQQKLNFKEQLSSYSSSIALQEHPTTVTLANICIQKGNKTITTNQFLRVLLNSGASNSLIKNKWISLGKLSQQDGMKFIIGNGIKHLDKAVSIEFTLCKWKFIVDENKDKYDIILGRDLLCTLGLCMNFEQRLIEWKGMRIKMRLLKEILRNEERHESLANEYILEPSQALEASDRMQQILDLNSEPTTQIEKWVDSIQHINHKEKDILYNIMQEYKRLPMGLASAPSYFQDKIDELFGDLAYIKAYIDNILIISYGDAQDHLQKLAIVFRRLKEAGISITT